MDVKKYSNILTVCLMIPILDADKTPDMAQSEMKVLIVDDDEDMRATLTDFISSKMGIKVRTAADVGEAKRILQAEVPPFDLVLADLKLPGGTGLDVLKAAHARSSETLITIITGYASLETAIEAIRLGAYDYMTKPFSLDEIGVHVRNMIERVSLAKENARLSVRLQELYEQVNRLQSEKSDLARFQEEIRRELQDTGRKLDILLESNVISSNSVAQGPEVNSVPEVLRGLDPQERAKPAGLAAAYEVEGRKRALAGRLSDKL
jgi:DNA-binding response OmpR family regulator